MNMMCGVHFPVGVLTFVFSFSRHNDSTETILISTKLTKLLHLMLYFPKKDFKFNLHFLSSLAMPYLRLLVADFSSWRPRFKSK